jgi:site-specific recombinase XerD
MFEIDPPGRPVALAATTTSHVPALLQAAGERAQTRFWEFFVANIRNPNTRRAYGRAIGEFLAWCEQRGLASIIDIAQLHIGAYVETLTRSHSAPTAKQRLAAIRMLFDWLVTGQIVATNPAASVRGPKHVKTPVLDPSEARALIATHAGLRDRALIALMVYSFARVGAALAMKVEDVYVQNRRLWVRLHEKGGKRHEMTCHHNLEAYLHAYIDGCGLAADPKGLLFRTIGRGTGGLTTTPLPQANTYAMPKLPGALCCRSGRAPPRPVIAAHGRRLRKRR